MRIAVDAMGGDFAPRNIVEGAIEALRDTGNRFEVILVGQKPAIELILGPDRPKGLAYRIVHAPEVIDMHDEAMAAVRQKKDSSIAVGVTLHRNGEADAFVSAGHTGAVMSASTLILGRIEGVGRPTIGTLFPTEKGFCLLFDAGANVDCKPQHLYEFATMGSIYAREMLSIPNPRVGLVSIGEESTKGDAATVEAHRLLSAGSLNFIGNIEGRDILKGKADVVVCDGFVGNVILKFAESVAGYFKTKFRDYAGKNIFRKLWVGMMVGTMRSVMKNFDYQQYGGVPLLGVNGVSIIGHGKSSPLAVKNMILKAEEMAGKNINRNIHEALAAAK